ncbi:hypothetical protein GCM10010466_31920 [Planomonospora alba]|uniref:Uncharacterized protein n=1 Tax=Planomonospora alba TaxID=161354 RepID=A0ABP6N720_9ACTN
MNPVPAIAEIAPLRIIAHWPPSLWRPTATMSCTIPAVIAYLERRSALERDGIGQAIEQSGGDVDAALRVLFEAVGAIACAPGFRGCPFIGAAAEHSDPDSPVRRAVTGAGDPTRR